jgi:hypothetical protein
MIGATGPLTEVRAITRSLPNPQNDNRPNLAVLGLAGGILGAGLMALLQLALRPYLRRRCTPGWIPDAGIGFQAVFRMPEPSSLTARRLLPHSSETAISPMVAAFVVHAAFGALSGIFYTCVLHKRFPFQKSVALGFGAVLWCGATELVLPLLSLSRPPTRSSLAIQLFGLAEHLVYSLTVQQTCRAALHRSSSAPPLPRSSSTRPLAAAR